MPPRTRKPPAAAPVTPTVHVTHGATSREIPYRPTGTVWALLTDAVRAHGKRFADNAHLRLHHPDGTPLANTATALTAEITPGTTLTLKPPTT